MSETMPIGDKRCVCVARHNPAPLELQRHHVWPLGEGGPDVDRNLRWLCPTTHMNVHRLWRDYDHASGAPEASVLRPYSRYVRALVAQGWAEKASGVLA